MLLYTRRKNSSDSQSAFCIHSAICSLYFLSACSLRLTIFLIFLLSLRTPETCLLEGIVFEVTHFIKSNMWPFWFRVRGWRNIVTTDSKGPPINKFCAKSISNWMSIVIQNCTGFAWRHYLFDPENFHHSIIFLLFYWSHLMASSVISVCSDWPLRLLWFCFHRAQPKCAPVAFSQTFCFVYFQCGSGIKIFKLVR